MHPASLWIAELGAVRSTPGSVNICCRGWPALEGSLILISTLIPGVHDYVVLGGSVFVLFFAIILLLMWAAGSKGRHR